MSDDLSATLAGVMDGSIGGDGGGTVETASSDSAAPMEQGVGEGASGGPSQDGDVEHGSDIRDGGERTPASRARDATGKFAKADPAQAKAKEVAAPTSGPPGGAREKGNAAAPPPQGAAGNAEPPASPPSETFKPPQSWTPGAREEWAKVPLAVQREIDKRERDVARGFQEHAESRRIHQSFQQTVGPYEGLMRAHGATDSLQAVGQIVQTWAGLQAGPPQQKAQILGNLFKGSGLTVEQLAAAIDGTPTPQGQQSAQGFGQDDINRLVDQRVTEALATRQSGAARQRAGKEVQDFRAKAEFFDDVRDRMAALVSADERGGVERPLQDVYDEACWGHPDIRKVLQQRQEAEAAKAREASTQRARLAGSSVRNQPAAPINGAQRDDLGSVLASVMAQANGR